MMASRKSYVLRILIVIYCLIIPFGTISLLILENRPDPTDVAFNLTDLNWENGVSRTEAAFFVQENPENFRSFKVGTRIKFKTGVRTIREVTRTEPWLNIYLTGGLLSPTVDGYPNTFQVLDK